MTALKQYARLETTGLWRSSKEAQRKDVIVSFGDATLVIADKNDRALSHWSLSAVDRLNPGQTPALYGPEGDDQEQLEIADDDMILAIEKVRKAVERHRPHPGRLRLLGFAGSFVAVLIILILWLPGALRDHSLRVVPDVKRAEIGNALLAKIERIAGQPCMSPAGSQALDMMRSRVMIANPITIYQSGLPITVHLPGGAILAQAKIFEDHDAPEVAAGYLVAEAARARQSDALKDLLDHAGFIATFRFLTTANFPDAALTRYAETLLSTPPKPIDDEDLLAAFDAADLPISPYAYALDPSGETTLALIEADPISPQTTSQILPDGDWISLQGICGE
ncbi:hypothetical protein [Parasulfitobacter algicola]|uniref:Uncharacterized protein n=1 Tax=Parasulfitobacter algicola TaxID=2614809 RepID=A0ABX2IX58_9RHOB|nr:hypothetical protein [Sulfitobacter algicola]NSX55044.1 hypothetical protein [Sulfitobacter algicola]